MAEDGVISRPACYQQQLAHTASAIACRRQAPAGGREINSSLSGRSGFQEVFLRQARRAFPRAPRSLDGRKLLHCLCRPSSTAIHPAIFLFLSVPLRRLIFVPQNEWIGPAIHSVASFCQKTRVLRPQNGQMGTPIHSVAIRAEIGGGVRRDGVVSWGWG